jgi:uncharacterized membrane protein YgcG
VGVAGVGAIWLARDGVRLRGSYEHLPYWSLLHAGIPPMVGVPGESGGGEEVAVICGQHEWNCAGGLSIGRGGGETEGSLMDLVSRKYLKLNSLVWTVWFTYGFVYYGIILFTTRLFAHDDDDDADDDKTCSFDYLHLMISAFVEFIALFFVLLGIEKIARNLFQSAFYGLSALFCVLFAFFDTSTVLITMFSSLIRLAVRGGLTVTWIATPELYPTHIRSSGHAIASSMVRLAGVLCPFLASNDSVSETMVCLVLFVVSLFATVAAFFTPDSRYFDLDNNHVENVHKRSGSVGSCKDSVDGQSGGQGLLGFSGGSGKSVSGGERGTSWESLLPAGASSSSSEGPPLVSE